MKSNQTFENPTPVKTSQQLEVDLFCASNSTFAEAAAAIVDRLNAFKQYSKVIPEINTLKAPNVNRDWHGFDTVLGIAVQRQNTKALKLLIASRANINGRDFHLYTALMHAAKLGNLEHVTLLLDAKADIDIRTGWGGSTALDFAIQNGQDKCAKLLAHAHARAIKSTSHSNIPDNKDAIQPQIKPTETVTSGQDLPGFKNEVLENDLYLASNNKQLDKAVFAILDRLAALKRYSKIIPEIQKLSTPSVDPLFPLTTPALHKAVRWDNIKALKMLIDAGANINIKEESLFSAVTPLMLAAMLGRPEHIKVLLDAKANIDIQHHYLFSGKTALDFAIEKGQEDCAELLASAHAQAATKSTPISKKNVANTKDSNPVIQTSNFISSQQSIISAPAPMLVNEQEQPATPSSTIKEHVAKIIESREGIPNRTPAHLSIVPPEPKTESNIPLPSAPIVFEEPNNEESSEPGNTIAKPLSNEISIGKNSMFSTKNIHSTDPISSPLARKLIAC